MNGVDGAVEAELTFAHGRDLGLADNDVTEVVQTWLEWYRTRPVPVDYRRIRWALTDHAMSKQWRPV